MQKEEPIEMTTAMLLPEPWLVQPPVVPMHVLREPNRQRRANAMARRSLTLGKRQGGLTTYDALRDCDRGRMLAVGMNPPSGDSLRIMRFVLLGDHRYWNWKATKRPSKGLIRNSLSEELGLTSGNVSRALKPLLADGLLEIAVDGHRREQIRFTELGKVIFAEIGFRWKLRDAVPGIKDHAEMYGYQEVALQVTDALISGGFDPDARADLIHAAKDSLANGEPGGGILELPADWG